MANINSEIRFNIELDEKWSQVLKSNGIIIWKLPFGSIWAESVNPK